MNGYSKMKSINTTKSRSIDFSDLFISSSSSPSSSSLHQHHHRQTTPKSSSSRLTSSITQNPNPKIQDPINNTQIRKLNPFEEKEENEVRPHDDDHDQEKYNSNGVADQSEMGFDDDLKKMKRTTSVSSSASSTMKRVFSMRRSFSVSSSNSERYCRIHDQSVTLASPMEDINEDGTETIRSAKKKKHTKARILKACKKIFGL